MCGTLAQMHTYMKLPLVEDYMEPSLEDIYQRHNQELRKIRKFIRKKGASCSVREAVSGDGGGIIWKRETVRLHF